VIFKLKNTDKKEKWICTSAWPYVNAIPHLGNMIGSILSADVFARYLRLKGAEVAFVSGSDMHGTPTAVAAKQEKISTEDLSKKNHKIIKELFEKWQISFDNYTDTHNPVHMKFIQDFYLEIQKNGYIFVKETEEFYCESCKLFLPDRFIVGTCPYCGYEAARGDQCDSPECGKLLTPMELIGPHCNICGQKPIIKKTKHWYLDFPKLEKELKKFINENKIIPANARTSCLNSIKKGIPQRAITRDLEWGIPAPFKGAENKTIYVWFEAVLGYISAVKEWAEKKIKDPSKFAYFWKDKETRSVYFIGKDNIIFHLLIFPGLIMAYNKNKSESNKFGLPYNVSSTEFLMYENDKFSKSRGKGIWIDEALELAPVDYWRFNLIYNRPEKSDTSFLWSEFQNNINILNDIVGNFIHRTFTFIYNYFGGIVPPRGHIDKVDEEFLGIIGKIGEDVGNFIEEFELKKAIKEVITCTKKANVYLTGKEPWHLIKKDKEKAGTVLNICIQFVHSLAILLEPFIPLTSKKITKYLNIEFPEQVPKWLQISDEAIQAGHAIKKPSPLFQKLDVDDIKNKLEEIRSQKGEKIKLDWGTKKTQTITYEEFKKLDIRVAKIIEAEPIKNADRLLKIKIDLGFEQRTLVAGLAQVYKLEELIGKKIILLANLQPKKMKGILSQGMLLAAVDENDKVSLLTIDKDLDIGSKIE
jgi:methionyl-tRNA synthetase